MYEAFYGLNEKPFNLTPDPRFLFLSSKHKEAFAHLLYGIRNRSGFVMVSGEIGTGKTTICRSLLKQLDPDTEVAFIFNPKLSPIELLKTINADFGIASRADTIRGLIDELNTHLLHRAGKGKNCALIIDEAQNLGTETLEQIRLLSNLETETEKLLQIVLIGQPELAEKLALNELRQLNQRITARYHLGSLTRDETLHYIAFRLRVAGGQKKVRFTRAAVRHVHRISRGTPRVINALCDRALLIGYTKEARTITPAIVRKAAREVHGAPVRPRRRVRLLPVSALATTAALAIVAALFVRGDIRLPDAPVPGVSGRVTDPSASANSLPEAPRNDPSVSPGATAPSLVAATAGPAPEVQRGIAEAAILARAALAKPDPAATPEVTPDPFANLARVPGGAETGGMKVVETSPTVHLGVDALARAWISNVKQVAPIKVTADAFDRFAAANGLQTLKLKPTVDELVALGLPALIRLNGDEWAALVHVQDGKADLVGRDGAKTAVPLSELGEKYAREAYYLWKDPSPGAGLLRASTSGKQVEDLQRDLQQLGLLNRDPNGVYDAPTIDTITKIQRSTGLGADGIAGPQTRMVLVSWLGADGTPQLTDSGFTDRARDRVLARQGIVTPARQQPREAETPQPAPPPAPQPDVIEPEMEFHPVPAEGAPADSPAPADSGDGQSPPAETYTPILPEAPPANSPAVTPSTFQVVPIRPAGDRESLQR